MKYSPENFEIEMLGFQHTENLAIILIYVILVPAILFLIREKYENTQFKILKLWAEFVEATILPCFLFFMSLQSVVVLRYAILSGNYDTFSGHVGVGLAHILSFGLLLMVAYIILRQLGYCKKIEPVAPKQALVLIASVYIALWSLSIWILNLSFEHLRGIDLTHFLFTPLSIAIALGIRRFSKKPLSTIISDQALLNTILYVTLALSYWIMGNSNDKAKFIGVVILASAGFIIGSLMYLTAIFWSWTEDNSASIEVRLKNWHFLELFTVFFFFLFAPESMSGWASRIENDAKSEAVLSELRGLSGGTVIDVGNITAKQKDYFNGTVCADASNRGQNSATDLTVELVRPDSLWCKDPNDLIKIQIRLAVLENLGIGKTETLCGEYKISTEKNDYDKYRKECPSLSFSELFKNIGYVDYSITYSEDPKSRFDYNQRAEINRVY